MRVGGRERTLCRPFLLSTAVQHMRRVALSPISALPSSLASTWRARMQAPLLHVDIRQQHRAIKDASNAPVDVQGLWIWPVARPQQHLNQLPPPDRNGRWLEAGRHFAAASSCSVLHTHLFIRLRWRSTQAPRSTWHGLGCFIRRFLKVVRTSSTVVKLRRWLHAPAAYSRAELSVQHGS